MLIIDKKFSEDPEDFIPRFVFAKNPSKYDAYTFLGIFKPLTTANTTRKYIRISESYKASPEASFESSSKIIHAKEAA